MEKEVFAECGSWKHWDDLENSLTLEELVELYDIAAERQMRLAKVIAGAFGAEFGDEPRSQQGNVAQGPINIAGGAIGYQKVAKE